MWWSPCLALGIRRRGRPAPAREVSGFGDPRFRFSVNFSGAPALSLQEFAGYRAGSHPGGQLAGLGSPRPVRRR